MKKILAIILGALMCLSLAACGGSKAVETTAAAAADDPYVGKQFAASTPWGAELAVTIRENKNNELTWTFTLSDGNDSLYNEVTGTKLTDGKGEFKVEGEVEPESGSTNKKVFSYSGDIELKDGNVVITLKDGALTSQNENGGGAAWQVQALSDAEKVITLKEAKQSESNK